MSHYGLCVMGVLAEKQSKDYIKKKRICETMKFIQLFISVQLFVHQVYFNLSTTHFPPLPPPFINFPLLNTWVTHVQHDNGVCLQQSHCSMQHMCVLWCLLLGCLLSQQHAKRILGMDLLRFIHAATLRQRPQNKCAVWHLVNPFNHCLYNVGPLVEKQPQVYQCLSHWCDLTRESWERLQDILLSRWMPCH